jgi:nicotinamidase-related amidase
MPTTLMSREASVLVIVDVQERLMPAIHDGAAMLARLGLLADTARRLGIPVLVTEQYPKGLGVTVDTVRASLVVYDPVVKVEFSCVPVPAFAARWAALGRSQAVLAGVETHVCMAQSALDLAAAGVQVFLPADATSSRRPLDRDIAIERMRAGGVTVTTAEAVVFEWLRRAGTDEFKDVSQALKALPA